MPAARRSTDVTGRSFVPLLRGQPAAWRDAFLYEYNYEKQFPYTPNVRGVRTDRWKLIRYPHGDGTPDRFTAELYDLQSDPYEMRNLIATRRTPASGARLERLLDRVSRARPAPIACPSTRASSTCGPLH